MWAYVLVCNRCADGRQLKCLTLVDEWMGECLAIEVAGSIRSNRVIEVLARLPRELATAKSNELNYLLSS